jgi:hypothetical protein
MPFSFPTFANIYDITITYQMVKEWCDRYFPLLPYQVLQTPVEGEIDEVHDEVPLYMKRWGEVVNLRAYVAPADQIHPLTMFGIEELRDAVLFVSVPNLVEVGLATQDPTTKEVVMVAGPGDKFEFPGGVVYEVLEWRRGPGFGNTDVPLLMQANAEKLRLEATSYPLQVRE